MGIMNSPEATMAEATPLPQVLRVNSKSKFPELPIYKYRLSFAVSSMAMAVFGLFIAYKTHTYVWYGAIPIAAVLIPLLYIPRFYRGALASKMIIDMVLIVASLFHGNMPRDALIICLYLTAVIYFWFNLQITRLRVIQYAVGLYLLVPAVYAVIRSAQGGLGAVILSVPVSVLFSALSYILFESKLSEEQRKEEVFSQLSHRYNMADGSLRLANLKQGLLIHDCRNILNRIAKVEIAALKGDCPSDLARDMIHMRNDLLEKLESMRRLESVRFYPAQVLDHMYRHMPPRSDSFSVSVPESLCINFRQNLFESLAFNFAQNAWEAFSNTGKDATQFRFEVTWGEHSLVFRDNAGGFDPESIQMGHSTKENGQGRFLATLLENSKELDMRLHLNRWEKGMAIRMEFPTELISSD